MLMEAKNPNRLRTTIYTREQKIVAAVWYHERLYTGMTYEQLAANFNFRFQAKFPNYNTLKAWDTKLFKDGSLKDKSKRRRTALKRLIHIPYIKESFIRFPNLLDRHRARMLGMSQSSLKIILTQDIDPQEVELLKKKGREKLKNDSDKNVSKSLQGSCSESSRNNNDSNDKNKEGDCDNKKIEGTVKVEIVSDEDVGNSENLILLEEVLIKDEK